MATDGRISAFGKLFRKLYAKKLQAASRRRQHIHSSLSQRQLHITHHRPRYYLIFFFILKNAFCYLQIESSSVFDIQVSARLVASEYLKLVPLHHSKFFPPSPLLRYHEKENPDQTSKGQHPNGLGAKKLFGY